MYANYGTVDDFLELEKRNLKCTGKIVIMRYGKIFRGNKVKFEKRLVSLHGCSAGREINFFFLIATWLLNSSKW